MLYAVAIGRERKVVETWNEYKRLTEGYPGAKGKKVNTYEEGLDYIDSIIKDTVITKGYEPSLIGKRSSIPYCTTLTNCFITIRYSAEKTFKPHETVLIKVYAVISTNHKLPLTEISSETKWDKRNRYFVEEEFLDVGITPQLAYIKFITLLIKYLRRNFVELSLTLNTESNYLVHLLSNDITNDYEVISSSPLKYGQEVRGLYDEVSMLEGLHLNYESKTQISSDGSYLNNIIRRESVSE